MTGQSAVRAAAFAAHVGQQGVGPLLFDDLGQPLRVERLDIRHIRDAGVGHDGGRVGIDQHHLVAFFLEGLHGLGAGIVEFTALADDDGTCADNQNFV